METKFENSLVNERFKIISLRHVINVRIRIHENSFRSPNSAKSIYHQHR